MSNPPLRVYPALPLWQEQCIKIDRFARVLTTLNTDIQISHVLPVLQTISDIMSAIQGPTRL